MSTRVPQVLRDTSVILEIFKPMKYCLVVDDSRVIRIVARRIMEELQYSVEEAEDGMAALRAVRDKMPDLIFLDWNLPTMKGVEFVKSVRGQ